MIRDKILQAKCRVEPVDVSEWDTRVYVRQFTVAERDDYLSLVNAVKGTDKEKDLAPVLVCRTLCDEHGVRVFGDGEEHLLSSQPAAALDKIILAATSLNNPDAAAAKKN